ncbi:MAG: mannose-1-phosphate guanylyltransferase, partial [Bacteroidales bacterium]|nr:mannose-1-phosphate guanylyltransferase [Candidatus Sodaliphilus fimicaballi]
HCPDIAAIFDAGEGKYGTSEEQEFIQANFPSCRNISIDYAVMEKAPNVYVECVDFGWSDLGTWGSLYENSSKDEQGNATQGSKAMLVNSHNNFIAVKGDKVIITSGLENYIVADVDDALLIIPRDQEQNIRRYVNEAKSKFGDKYI